MENTFACTGIPSHLEEGLKKLMIHTPTPIQAAAIPAVLAGQDVIGQSSTSSGKTFAYLLPLMARMDASKRENQVLVLTPTYELALQVADQVRLLADASGLPFQVSAINGQAGIQRQIEKLREKPQFIVGTAPRILALIQKKKIAAHQIRTVVLDEADRLFDPQQFQGVEQVIRTTLRDRQLLAFSATMTEHARNLAKDRMKDPVLLLMEEPRVNANLTHLLLVTPLREKTKMLRKAIAAEKPTKAMVFLNQAVPMANLESTLAHHSIPVASIRGDAGKQARKAAMEKFRSGKCPILLSSDLASRGLDVPQVTHIFNMDLPDSAEDYLHRAGRGGRNGLSGKVLNICTAGEAQQLKKMAKALQIRIQSVDLENGSLQPVSSEEEE
ncbi:DEAD/DEAH box helicase [Anaerotalea alkaliphila]|uniref:DEAD/DEAH box helicase n=1 Tax=Anaerotalea alkaliphila TaxID=2662126 RepID=A0A7X5KMG8_9FIRM|nr:DEAD/DEAH box helicase [Anaerotalea alkaliphila]NDL66944.1 DEAD/DEAH box helicase [Anaerotalea alkaliphila]